MTAAQTTESAIPTKASMMRDFVARIAFTCANDPGARAALRLGLRKPYNDILPATHRAVIAAGIPSDPHDLDMDSLRAFYTIAALIATVPRRTAIHVPASDGGIRSASGVNLGACLAEAVQIGSLREGSAESHLGLLAKQSTAGLHRHLPGVIGQIAERPGVDWVQLLTDLEAWPRSRNVISRRWLQGFYQARYRADMKTAEGSADQPDPTV